MSNRHLLYYFSRAAITKYVKLGCLDQYKFTISQFWKLELKTVGKHLFHASLLASGSCWQSLAFLSLLSTLPVLCLQSGPSVSSHNLPSVPVSLCVQLFHFYKDTLLD